jgi:lysophospholipase L1-like esterase
MDSSYYVRIVKDTILDINSWIRSKGDELSIPVIDPYPFFDDGKDHLKDQYAAGDNAHLNVDGQKLLSNLIYEGYFKEAENVAVIVCLGDSHTQGYPMRTDISRNGIPIDPDLDTPDNFPFFLAGLTGFRTINRGIAGNTVYGMLKRFDEEVLPHYPDHCVILGGTNDALIGTRPDETKDDLERLYTKCIDARIVPVACTIVPLGL